MVIHLVSLTQSFIALLREPRLKYESIPDRANQIKEFDPELVIAGSDHFNGFFQGLCLLSVGIKAMSEI